MTIHPLRDFQNSWCELLAMYDRLEASDEGLLDWDSPEDYKVSFSSKSVEMASLVRELHPSFGDRTVAGVGMFGVVLSVNQSISQMKNHTIALRITPDKQVQVGLLGHGPLRLGTDFVDCKVCSREAATSEIETFVEFLVAEADSSP